MKVSDMMNKSEGSEGRDLFTHILMAQAAAYGALSAYHGKEFARRHMQALQKIPGGDEIFLTDKDMDAIDTGDITIFRDLDEELLKEMEDFVEENF